MKKILFFALICCLSVASKAQEDSLRIKLDSLLRDPLRMTDTNACGNVVAKTGTVTGISSLAGYLTSGDGYHGPRPSGWWL